MLSPVEKILFTLAVLASLYFTWRGVQRIIRNIASGQGKVDWSLAWKRLGTLIAKVGLFQPVFRFRLGPSILHGLIGWGFLNDEGKGIGTQNVILLAINLIGVYRYLIREKPVHGEAKA